MRRSMIFRIRASASTACFPSFAGKCTDSSAQRKVENTHGFIRYFRKADVNLKHLFYFWKVATAGGVLRAAEELHVTPQTISGQIQSLEESLSTALFERHGRKLELTESGRLALEYADEMFALRAELEEALRQHAQSRQTLFRVGVADAVPKALVHRLLASATQIDQPVRMVCREWKLDSLLTGLALHRLDVVLADVPLPGSLSARAYSHRLGDSGMSFLASRALAAQCRGAFPRCLSGMPLLLPGEDAPVRQRLLRWLDKHKIRARIVGEFDDSALMNTFGGAGAGVFIAPSMLEAETRRQYGVEAIGRSAEVRSEFFAIAVERRLTHPCVVALMQAARERLFAG
jgi:LysR family transcriptional regulator, transcriptional activator of nhaA